MLRSHRNGPPVLSYRQSLSINKRRAKAEILLNQICGQFVDRIFSTRPITNGNDWDLM